MGLLKLERSINVLWLFVGLNLIKDQLNYWHDCVFRLEICCRISQYMSIHQTTLYGSETSLRIKKELFSLCLGLLIQAVLRYWRFWWNKSPGWTWCICFIIKHMTILWNIGVIKHWIMDQFKQITFVLMEHEYWILSFHFIYQQSF